MMMYWRGGKVFSVEKILEEKLRRKIVQTHIHACGGKLLLLLLNTHIHIRECEISAKYFPTKTGKNILEKKKKIIYGRTYFVSMCCSLRALWTWTWIYHFCIGWRIFFILFRGVENDNK